MRGDTRSLIHGIINLIVPFFIYDLASLLVGAITAANYDPWLAFWPMTILCLTRSASWWLPCASSVGAVPARCWD
jgi:hypothetical protein